MTVHPQFGSASATLHGIFTLNARRRPDALALVDPINRESFTAGPARRLTYLEAEQAVAALAVQLGSLALPTRSVVGVQFPNTVDGVLVTLAALRAGLVPAFLSLAWGRKEMAQAVEQCAARAIIVGGEVAGVDHPQIAMDVAADVFGVRYVCGLAERLPDGVVPLGIDAAATAGDADDTMLAGAPEWPAVITFDGSATTVPRTHAQVLAGGFASTLEAGLPRGCVLATTMLPASFAALACGFVPWLLTGGTLVLHQPFDPVSLRQQLAELPADAIAVPGPLADALVNARMIGAPDTRTFAVWRTPSQQPTSPRWTAQGVLTDILAFEETAIVPMRREDDGAPRPLPFGPVRTPSHQPDAQTVLLIDRAPDGGLVFTGPMVPVTAEEEAAPPARQMAG